MVIKLRSRPVRSLIFLLGDIISIFAGIAGAVIVFQLSTLPNINFFAYGYAYLLPPCFIAGLAFFDLYAVSWRFTSLRELVHMVGGLMTGFVSFLVLCAVLQLLTSVVIVFSSIAFTISLLLIGIFRISKRIYLEVIRHPASYKNIAVFGAGNACDQIIRDIQRNDKWKRNIAAIFDDDPTMMGMSIQGVRVQGGCDVLYDYLEKKVISELIVAAPSIPKKRLKEIINKVNEIDPELTVKVLPSFHRLSDNPIGVKNIRDIRIEDIIGREPASVDMESIEQNIKGKTVFITGAGGSIGSEIVRQCASFQPKQLIAFDIDETELYNLKNELSEVENLITLVGDVTDSFKVKALFKKYSPDIVYHAAAYKHVPMMERFPEEAIKVNIRGTQVMAYLCCEFDIDKFVLISTDKAVNPTNVMGATKRIAEQVCMAYHDISDTKFIAVRFGNVLGSRGSVVPLFLNQINDGGPVTVTHPEITRYFMTIPEAVLLVIQSGSMGAGGEVFLLDMGEPVKIMNMAKELIKLNGLVPDKDIDIEINGLRPGEKMYEELLNTNENVEKTQNAQIFKTKCQGRFEYAEINNYVNKLTKEIKNNHYDSLRLLLKQGVPTYKYSNMESVQAGV